MNKLLAVLLTATSLSNISAAQAAVFVSGTNNDIHYYSGDANGSVIGNDNTLRVNGANSYYSIFQTNITGDRNAMTTYGSGSGSLAITGSDNTQSVNTSYKANGSSVNSNIRGEHNNFNATVSKSNGQITSTLAGDYNDAYADVYGDGRLTNIATGNHNSFLGQMSGGNLNSVINGDGNTVNLRAQRYSIFDHYDTSTPYPYTFVAGGPETVDQITSKIRGNNNAVNFDSYNSKSGSQSLNYNITGNNLHVDTAVFDSGRGNTFSTAGNGSISITATDTTDGSSNVIDASKGKYKTLGIYQDGNNNSASLNVSGTGNNIILTQHNGHNLAANVNGSRNDLNLDYDKSRGAANQAIVSVAGSNNTLTDGLDQYTNKLVTRVSGDVSFRGSNNTLNVASASSVNVAGDANRLIAAAVVNPYYGTPSYNSIAINGSRNDIQNTALYGDVSVTGSDNSVSGFAGYLRNNASYNITTGGSGQMTISGSGNHFINQAIGGSLSVYGDNNTLGENGASTGGYTHYSYTTTNAAQYNGAALGNIVMGNAGTRSSNNHITANVGGDLTVVGSDNTLSATGINQGSRAIYSGNTLIATDYFTYDRGILSDATITGSRNNLSISASNIGGLSVTGDDNKLTSTGASFGGDLVINGSSNAATFTNEAGSLNLTGSNNTLNLSRAVATSKSFSSVSIAGNSNAINLNNSSWHLGITGSNNTLSGANAGMGTFYNENFATANVNGSNNNLAFKAGSIFRNGIFYYSTLAQLAALNVTGSDNTLAGNTVVGAIAINGNSNAIATNKGTLSTINIQGSSNQLRSDAVNGGVIMTGSSNVLNLVQGNINGPTVVGSNNNVTLSSIGTSSAASNITINGGNNTVSAATIKGDVSLVGSNNTLNLDQLSFNNLIVTGSGDKVTATAGSGLKSLNIAASNVNANFTGTGINNSLSYSAADSAGVGGKAKTAIVSQTGNNNAASLAQNGTGATATIATNGSGNSVAITQNVSGGILGTYVNGYFVNAPTASDNSVGAYINGNNGTIRYTTNSSGSVPIVLTGDNHTASITQSGPDNQFVGTTITGTHNAVLVNQSAGTTDTHNFLTITTVGGLGTAVWTKVANGGNNKVGVTGGVAKAITLSGTDNSLNYKQAGTNNVIGQVQVAGNGNGLNISQTGLANKVGSDGLYASSISGSNNGVKIEQNNDGELYYNYDGTPDTTRNDAMQGNSVGFVQSGSGNILNSQQTTGDYGNGNTGLFQQNGVKNSTIVSTVTGSGNQVNMNQLGGAATDGSSIRATITGTNNLLGYSRDTAGNRTVGSFAQTGSYNTVAVNMQGNNNQLNLTQAGNGNSYDYKQSNTRSTYQPSNCGLCTPVAIGGNNTASLTTNGNGNTVNHIIASNTGYNTLSAVIIGNRNTVNQTASGGSKLKATITNGDGNAITQNDNGYNELTAIINNGNNNTITQVASAGSSASNILKATVNGGSNNRLTQIVNSEFSSNTLTSVANGSLNVSTLDVRGSNNIAAITQTQTGGLYNKYTLNQNGNNNFAAFNQTGTGLTASITQIGDGNSLNMAQTGANPSINITQRK